MKIIAIILSVLLLGSVFGFQESFADASFSTTDCNQRYMTLYNADWSVKYNVWAYDASQYDILYSKIRNDAVNSAKLSNYTKPVNVTQTFVPGYPIDHDSKIDLRIQTEIHTLSMYLNQRITLEELQETYYKTSIVEKRGNQIESYLPGYVILPPGTMSTDEVLIPFTKIYELANHERVHSIDPIRYDRVAATSLENNCEPSTLPNVFLPPLKQIKNGLLPQHIVCNEGLMLGIKSSNSFPVCVTPQSAEKLQERGWIKP